MGNKMTKEEEKRLTKATSRIMRKYRNAHGADPDFVKELQAANPNDPSFSWENLDNLGKTKEQKKISDTLAKLKVQREGEPTKQNMVDFNKKHAGRMPPGYKPTKEQVWAWVNSSFGKKFYGDKNKKPETAAGATTKIESKKPETAAGATTKIESKKPETAAGTTTKIEKGKKLGTAAGTTTKIKKEEKLKELDYEISGAGTTTKQADTNNWSTKQRKKTINKNAGKNNRKAKIKDKIEKVTPTTDKTDVSTKDRSTKQRKKTINKNAGKNNREARNNAKIGAGGETVSETVSEPVSGASTNRRTRDKNANKKTTSEATAIDGDKTVGKKGSGTGAPVNNEHVRAYKKHRTNTEFRRRDNELSKEEEQSFKEPDSAETKKTKDKSKKKYFKRVMSFLGKKGEGVNAREVYRRQRKRGGSTKNLLTTDRKENYTMTGGRGKGLDVDSDNKSYDSRYKKKKGGGTGASGNKKISLNDAHVQAWKKSGDHDAHVQAWKKSKDHDAHVQAWKRSKTGQSGNNSASGGNKSDWNTTKFTDPQLKTRNKRLFNTLKSRGR